MGRNDVPAGTLTLMVLRTLDQMGPLHGWGIARRIEQVGLAPAAARVRGRIYAAMGRTSEALAEIERIKRDNTAGDRAVTYAAIYAQLGRADEAIAALEQGVEAHFRREPGAMQPFVPMDPVFDPIRGHPRFVAMLERAKLPRYPLPVRQ
jgi:tetratricopeptide (TPR) repeat protein